MDTQNVNFAVKFEHNKGFPASKNFAILEENFPINFFLSQAKM